MKKLARLKQSVSSLFSGKKRIAPIQNEEELDLYFSKDELFDRHVLLPHAELNPAVYEAVRQFTERYSGAHMTLTVFCDSIGESLQHTFREVYGLHYEDEYRKVTTFLHRRYCRVILLVIISIIAYYVGSYWAAQLDQGNFFLDVITNIGAFCIWEIGYTHFERQKAVEERKRIIRARGAEICFIETGKSAENGSLR